MSVIRNLANNVAKKQYLKRFAKEVSEKYGTTEKEAMHQLQRAREEFGIPYMQFANKGLFNASDSELELAGSRNADKQEKFVEKIAVALGVSTDEARAKADHIKEAFGYTPKAIYIDRLFLMSDDQIAEFQRYSQDSGRKVVKKVSKLTGWSGEKVRSHMTHCKLDFGVDRDSYLSSRCFELTDEQLADIGNMRDSKKLSSKYNKDNAKILQNKQLFNQTYSEFLGRKYWVNRDTSFEEFAEFIDGLDEVFCKPLDSSIGRGAEKIEVKGKDPHELYDWFMDQSMILAEECLVQHPAMAAFYPQTLNTVRLITVLDNDQFYPVGSFVRFGVKGVTDNFSAGGIACGVDPLTGVVQTCGATKAGDVFEVHPTTGLKFEGFQIPHWDKILDVTERALRKVEGVNYVGWDIAIRDDDVVFVEGNSAPDYGVSQAAFITKGILIRPMYEMFLDDDGYPDMQQKIAELTKKVTGSSAGVIRRRLNAAAKGGLDYDFVKSNEIYNLTVKQIEIYCDPKLARKEIVDRIAEDNGVSVHDAYMAVRHAKKDFGISPRAFLDNDLFGSDDERLAEFAQSAKEK